MWLSVLQALGAHENSCRRNAATHLCLPQGILCEGLFILSAPPKCHRQIHRRVAAPPVNTQRFGSRIPGKAAGHRTSHLQRAQHQHPLPGAANWAKLIQKQRENKIKDKPGTSEEETSQCHRILMCISSQLKPTGALDFQTQSKIPATGKHPSAAGFWDFSSGLPPPRHQETPAVNNCQVSSLSTESPLYQTPK